MEQDKLRAKPSFRRINRATRLTGTLLCWTHATAMALTGAEILLQPSPSRWTAAWIGSWALTGALLIVWALLRTAQKQRLHQITQPEDDDPGTAVSDTTTYGQAA
ncbi:hypothetical protein [Streptomyces sp. NPDC048445]|uniref:hypothetical protein n=1 Tax=unclassified Streptomyces TaxID=2593676 RepID=UPI003717DB29